MHDERNKDKCPKCRCKGVDVFHHIEVDAPDAWIEYNCINCGWLVGEVDNSNYVSCYDFEDFVVEI